MVFFWKKRDNIQKMLEGYFEQCDLCFQLFETALASYVEGGLGDVFSAAVEKTHKAESAADDLRREIELTLYGKALLPESRGDLLGLVESFDRLPNIVETILFTIKCQAVQIPPVLLPDYKRLADINLQAYYLLRKAVEALLDNPKATLHATKEVDDKESESDRVERELISRIFQSDTDVGTKMLLKELVLLIGSVSDRAETTADRIGIIAIKRQI
jgi:uncharacterized protein